MRPRLGAGLFLSMLSVALLLTTGTASAQASTPTVTVTPNTGLQEGQTVTVTGSGFSADVTSYGLAQCNADAAPNVCIGQTVVVGSGGSFSTTFTVHQFVGPTDCGAAPKTCFIGGSNLNGDGGSFNEFDFAPLTFGPGLPESKADCKKGGFENFGLTKKECKDIVKGKG